MTIRELKELIEDLPDDMEVRYNYDTGHAYPPLGMGSVQNPADNWYLHKPAFVLEE